MGRIIGIDLGTTTSEISYMENDEAKIIPDCFGNRIVPSVVGKKEDGTVIVGQVAYNQLIPAPDYSRGKKTYGFRYFDTPW